MDIIRNAAKGITGLLLLGVIFFAGLNYTHSHKGSLLTLVAVGIVAFVWKLNWSKK